MCVAVPLRVAEVRQDHAGLAGISGQVAVVEVGSGLQEVRLEIVDRIPEPGDYVIVHAGFAIHTLSEEDARKSLALFQEAVQDEGVEPDTEAV